MKKLLISFLAVSFMIGCGSEKKDGEAKENKKKEQEAKDTVVKENDKPVEKEVAFQEGPEATVEIVKNIDDDEIGYHTIKIDLGMGYSIFADSAWFGGNDWLCSQYELKKDGELLYKFPHEDGDMRSMSVGNRKFEPSFPRVLKKGDQTIILVERYLGETEGGIQTDAIVLINDRFEKYMKNLSNTGDYKYEATTEKAEKIYNSIK